MKHCLRCGELNLEILQQQNCTYYIGVKSQSIDNKPTRVKHKVGTRFDKEHSEKSTATLLTRGFTNNDVFRSTIVNIIPSTYFINCLFISLSFLTSIHSITHNFTSFDACSYYNIFTCSAYFSCYQEHLQSMLSHQNNFENIL